VLTDCWATPRDSRRPGPAKDDHGLSLHEQQAPHPAGRMRLYRTRWGCTSQLPEGPHDASAGAQKTGDGV
jgi:hypothetical protein